MIALPVSANDRAHALFIEARAAMIDGGFRKTGNDAVRNLHKALDLISEAYELNPDDLDIRLTLAMAQGFEAKRQGNLSLAKKSRNHIRAIAEDFPDQQMGPGSLAGWHSEVAAAGFAARLALGARAKKAGALFRQAETLPGNQPAAFYMEYAKYLARRGPSRYREALEKLDALDRSPSTHPVDDILKEKGRALRQAIEAGKPKLVQRRVREATAFNGIKKWDDLPDWQPDS